MKKKTKFDDVTVELVMDAYGVGRTRALAILREKAAHEAALKREEEMKQRQFKEDGGKAPAEEMIPAEEFFVNFDD